MNLSRLSTGPQLLNFPRASGDEPGQRIYELDTNKFSPREWG